MKNEINMQYAKSYWYDIFKEVKMDINNKKLFISKPYSK
jgi:hypothetical protein